MKRVIISADDFGLSEGVNEAVEQAHKAGLLSTASLMVAGPAAADAVERAKRLPDLKVGLHVVAVAGWPVCAPHSLPKITDDSGDIRHDQTGLARLLAISPLAREEMRREIEAQFSAFAATGLKLDHANAHKHMHLHPIVGRMLIGIGRRYGLRALRIPMEPPSPLRRGGASPGNTIPAGLLRRWTRLLRAQAHAARLTTNDACFGIAWSGHMTAPRVRDLAASLPDGLSEIYFHPATRRDALLERLMPGYEHETELATLLDPGVAGAFDAAGVIRTDWSRAARGAA